ncbi:hypothetical protein HAV15_012467 [Penicillium sp. str. |nr:hypothetical protein HAV15_012467 [Penicillium sp. str. \
MKSSSYILVALLPLATQLAVATPVADPHPDTFEERGGGKHGDHGYDDKNACEVSKPIHITSTLATQALPTERHS